MKIKLAEIGERLNIRIPRDLLILEFIDFGDLKEIVIPDTEYNFCCYNLLGSEKSEQPVIIDYFISNKYLEATWTNNDGLSLRLAKLKEPFGAYVHVSIDEKDFGSVWLEWGDLGDPEDRVKLEDSFLEFLSRIEKGVNQDMVEDEFLPLEKHLYKNWGDKYWQIKESVK